MYLFFPRTIKSNELYRHTITLYKPKEFKRFHLNGKKLFYIFLVISGFFIVPKKILII